MQREIAISVQPGPAVGAVDRRRRRRAAELAGDILPCVMIYLSQPRRGKAKDLVFHASRLSMAARKERIRTDTHVLMGLNGVRANEIFFSLPSSFKTVPTKTQRPLSGTVDQACIVTRCMSRLTSVEKLQLLLRRRDGGQNGQSGLLNTIILDQLEMLSTNLLTRLLMLEAVPYSVVNILLYCEI